MRQLKRLILPLIGLLLLCAEPTFAATYTQVFVVSFGQTYTGQAANVRITIYDNAGVVQMAATNTPSGNAFAESSDAAAAATTGTYISRGTVDTAWLPIHVKYTLVGYSGVAASTTIGSDRAAALADGYTAARGALLSNLDAAISSRSTLTAAQAATAVWQDLLAGGDFGTTASIGKLLSDDVNATIGSRSTYAGTDTSGVTTLLTRIPGTVQPQTGDSYARLGTPSGASVSADIAAAKTSIGTPQQAGSAVVLPAQPAWAFFAGAPTNWLDSTSVAAITTSVFGHVVDGTLTYQQSQELAVAVAADSTRTWNATTHTAVLTWYRRASGGVAVDLTKPVMVKTTVYASDNVQVVSQTVTINAGNL